MKLTEWFPADVRPVRDGVYEVRYKPWMPGFLAMWDGLAWIDIESSNVLRLQDREWRGIEKP